MPLGARLGVQIGSQKGAALLTHLRNLCRSAYCGAAAVSPAGGSGSQSGSGSGGGAAATQSSSSSSSHASSADVFTAALQQKTEEELGRLRLKQGPPVGAPGLAAAEQQAEEQPDPAEVHCAAASGSQLSVACLPALCVPWPCFMDDPGPVL